MINHHPRMDRERRTVETMIGLYCRRLHSRRQHSTRHGLCAECEALRAYARQRLQKCPFQEGKTTCAKCRVHCYNPERRAQIRAVMRYAGPQMLVWHPWLTVQHMIDGLRKEPLLPQRTQAGRVFGKRAGSKTMEEF